MLGDVIDNRCVTLPEIGGYLMLNVKLYPIVQNGPNFACFQCSAVGLAGQPGEDVRSRVVEVSSGVIALATTPDPHLMGIFVSVTPTKTGFVADKVAQVCGCHRLL